MSTYGHLIAIWLAATFLTGRLVPDLPLGGSPGPCRGQLNLDGQVTGRAGQLL